VLESGLIAFIKAYSAAAEIKEGELVCCTGKRVKKEVFRGARGGGGGGDSLKYFPLLVQGGRRNRKDASSGKNLRSSLEHTKNQKKT